MRGVTAASIREMSMLSVARSTSTKTGTAPNCRIGLTVVGNPAATPITSSPAFNARSPSLGEVSEERASRFADEPELTRSEERDRIWEKQKRDYPSFAEYEKTANREIPVVILEPR